MTETNQHAENRPGADQIRPHNDKQVDAYTYNIDDRPTRNAPGRKTVEVWTPLSQWLAKDHLWTHFVTSTISPLMTFSKKPNVDSGLILRAHMVNYFDVLSEDTYGRRSFERPVIHATFFECLSKYRNPTAWHAHSLIYIEPKFWSRFEGKAEKLWHRRFCNRPGAILVEQIKHDKFKVASYSAKHDNIDCGVEPLYSCMLMNSK